MLDEVNLNNKSERLSLIALPSVLRNLSQLGRSGVLRFSYGESYAFLEINDGIVSRFLIQQNQFVEYVVHKLFVARIIKANIVKVLIDSCLNIEEFSEYLVREDYVRGAEIYLFLEKMAREILFNVFELKEGSLDFNVKTEILKSIEDSTYSLNLAVAPGQLFLDYWDSRKFIQEVEDEGGYFVIGNKTSFEAIYSPSESRILKRAENGAYIQDLFDCVFQAKDEVVEILMRLSKSGILISDTPISNAETKDNISVEESGSDLSTESDVALAPEVVKKEISIDYIERSLPFIVLALVLKFVIEFRATINFIENTFSN